MKGYLQGIGASPCSRPYLESLYPQGCRLTQPHDGALLSCIVCSLYSLAAPQRPHAIKVELRTAGGREGWRLR